jgi:hypothetical protein
MNDRFALFIRIAPAIVALPEQPSYTKSDLLVPAFRLQREGTVEVYYAPFDAINPAAQVILVGITPAFTQMERVYREARRALREGLSPGVALSEAKRIAAFSGSMRPTLTRWLDGIGLADALRLPGSDLLFGSQANLLYTTSAVRYPVFVNGENYNGRRPPLMKTTLLREYVFGSLAEDLSTAENALIIPLGKAVAEAVQALVAVGRLDSRRCLLKFPHPSGANAHGAAQYADARASMAMQVVEWFKSRR